VTRLSAETLCANAPNSGNFTNTEKAAYIKAVQCITTKPSKLSSTVAPGAKTRYDDFVAIHIQQTMNIHGTVRRPVTQTSI
jgi:hypothetical protein